MKEVIALIDQTLITLKDFQRETVKSVIASFHQGDSQRILVADEVGLGKTIVAKGVIAELLKERLLSQANKKQAPFRVTYICSNLTLADENRKKLAIFHGEDEDKYVLQPSFGRLLHTAINTDLKITKEKILEVCSLTPSTSFNLTQGHGDWYERLIVYVALIQNPVLSNYSDALSTLFSNDVNNWESEKEYFLKHKVLHKGVVNAFHLLLKNRISPKDKQYCGIDLPDCNWLDVLLAYCKNELNGKPSDTRIRTFIRALMAQACAGNLTADLFILDEFQRFKMLLDSDENNAESLIARAIFNNKKNKTKALLLSATPFKAVSKSEDDEEGNAHAEELNYLLRFLTLSDESILLEYEEHRKVLQQQILKLKKESFDLKSIDSSHKEAIEKILGSYLCRTERVQISDGYENLFCSSVPTDIERIKDFSKKDIEVFKILDQLGLALQRDHPRRSSAQLMEFYKASPWPLSFLTGYQFKKDLDESGEYIKKALKQSDAAWLSRKQIQLYQINMEHAPQAKIRSLIRQLFATPSEELLWVPPSLPHYPLQGSYISQEDFSKTLLFSSWAMVPRALSGLISYEAERRLLVNTKGERAYFKNVKHSPNIKFDEKSSLVGWSLVYPSKVLIDMPLLAGELPLIELLKQRIVILNEKIKKFNISTNGLKKDFRWYALAPMLLDKFSENDYLTRWLIQASSTRFKEKDVGKAQLVKIQNYLKEDHLELGQMPNDLAEYLAYLSIAGPAVTTFRVWSNHGNADDIDYALVATRVAFAVVSMFNKPEAESILYKRYSKEQRYFYAIAKYCADGGLQAVMDEYGHLLKDSGFSFNSLNDTATQRMIDVLSIMTSNVGCQFSEHKHRSNEQLNADAVKSQNKHSLRCHYAVPLGNQKLSDASGLERIGNVRDSFNSPFRPFVLNSTSIGQEGLDFHWYCSQIVHWNLPSNPIDIEQREGRINRYKSLVVRRRLAECYKLESPNSSADVWKELFDIADKQTKQNRKSDLVPYWHLPNGKAKIERFIPMMPLSKDVYKLDHSLKILAIYRLAFGQPRQEELLDNLLKRKFTEEEIGIINSKLVINLSPLKRIVPK